MSVKVALTGDFCPIGRINSAIMQDRTSGLFRGVQELFQESDLVIIDLECPLTEIGVPITKTGPHLKGHPKAAALLHALGCELVATANNHFMDFGWAGVQKTYEALHEYGVGWVGSGQTVNDASLPVVRECGGAKIAVLNMTENEWTTTHGDYPGCNPIDYPLALKAIKESREVAEFVIVILHGGHEHYELPSPRMQRQFRFMIDAGADAVVGHHTHVVSGYEVYRDKPILYSLGNFCIDDPSKQGTAWNHGAIVLLELSKIHPAQFTIHPIKQNDDKLGVEALGGEQRAAILRRIDKLSEWISNEQEIEKRFDQFCRSRSSILLSQIQPYTGSLALALHRRGFLPSVLGKRKRKLLAALCQCESHREVLLKALVGSL